MKIIDAHQHFWNYNTADFAWITADMAAIRKDFLPAELQSVYNDNNVAGCVTVQVNQEEKENETFLQYAGENDFIKGTVAWVDLMADNVEERLAYWNQYKKLKGFRHILQGEKDRALMLQPAFKNGISKLQQFNFTYDILIFPDQLQFALQLVQLFPQQKFVIDHLAKPYIKKGDIAQWQKDMGPFKLLDNVYCKVSGMVTEADWHSYSLQTFRPYLDVAVSTFGTKRLMYGSDWPVCLVAASYNKVLQMAQQYFSSFSVQEQEDVFCNTVTAFYGL